MTLNYSHSDARTRYPGSTKITRVESRHIELRCYQGIWNFEGPFHITTDPDVTPVVHVPWRCPITLKNEITRELDTMEDMGIISRVSRLTDWVSSLV